MRLYIAKMFGVGRSFRRVRAIYFKFVGTRTSVCYLNLYYTLGVHAAILNKCTEYYQSTFTSYIKSLTYYYPTV